MARTSGRAALAALLILGPPHCVSAQENSPAAIYDAINAAWQVDFLPDCTAARKNGFPFDPSSEKDASFGDLAGVFGPEGLFDRFFSQNLAEFVDSSGSPWKARQDIGISAETLARFEAAAFIRDNWFNPDGSLRVLVLDVHPEAFEAPISAVTLTMDGQVVRWTRDSDDSPSRFVWPGPDGVSSFEIEPPIEGRTNSITETGVWSMFRLLENFMVRPTDRRDSLRVISDFDSSITIFRLTAISGGNIFSRQLFPAIECPDAP